MLEEKKTTINEPLHCQIIQGAKFRVRERDSLTKLGILHITKDKLEKNLLWHVVWDDHSVTQPTQFPWINYCELYETNTQGYCLCNQCTSSSN